MKKVILLICVAVMAVSAWSADQPKQGLGLQIGWAQPILRLNSPNLSLAKDSLVQVTHLNGFKVGLVYDASIIKGFGASVGINYTFGAGTTGWKAATSISNYPRSRTQTIYNQLEVFADWQYKFEIAKETYLILYTGPTVQCGLGFVVREDIQTEMLDGSIVTTRLETNCYEKHEDTELAANDELKRLNVTWGIGAGFQYKRYFLRGGYDFGLINPYAHQKFVGTDRYTRGRLDQWDIRIGMYLWYNE